MPFTTLTSPFCEGRLMGLPEYYNTLSSLCMFLYTLYKLKLYAAYVNWGDFYQFYIILNLNCLYSALFHYTLWEGFKIFDETSMLVPLWMGINSCVKLLAESREQYIYNIYAIALFNLTFIVCNTFEEFQFMFPYLFGIEMLSLMYLYKKISFETKQNQYIDKGQIGICICLFAGILWFLTEKLCNSYLKYGHCVWHVTMPFGVDYIIQYILQARMSILKKKAILCIV